MTKRYIGPVRFIDKGDPYIAKQYHGIARKFLEMAIEKSGHNHVHWIRKLEDGTIIYLDSWSNKAANTGYNITIIPVEREEGEFTPRFTGVYIEPTSDDAPYGWGPPKDDEYPVGTPGNTPIGVIINNNPEEPYLRRTIDYGGDDYLGATPSYILDWPIPGELGYLTWKATNAVSTPGAFHRYLCKPLGTEIFSYNTLLCEIPEENLTGCCLQTVDDIRYLYAIIHKSGLSIKIIRRVFQSEYANDDAYDEDSNPYGWEDVSGWYAVGYTEGYTSGTEVLLNSGAYFSSDGTEAVITLVANTGSIARSPIGIIKIIVSDLDYSFITGDILPKATNDLSVTKYIGGGYGVISGIPTYEYTNVICYTPNGTPYVDVNLEDGIYQATWTDSTTGDKATSLELNISTSEYIFTEALILGADYRGNTLVTIDRGYNAFERFDKKVYSASGSYSKEYTVMDCMGCTPLGFQRAGLHIFQVYTGYTVYTAYNSVGLGANLSITYGGTELPVISNNSYVNNGAYYYPYDYGQAVIVTDYSTESIIGYDCGFTLIGTWNNSTVDHNDVSSTRTTLSESYIIYIDLRYTTPPILCTYSVDVAESTASGIVTLSIGSAELFSETIVGNIALAEGDVFPTVTPPSSGTTTHKSSFGLNTINSAFSTFHNTKAVTDRYGYTYIEFPLWTKVESGGKFSYFTVDLNQLTQYTTYGSQAFNVFYALGYTGTDPAFNTLLLV